MNYDLHGERRHEGRDKRFSKDDSSGHSDIWIDVKRPHVSVIFHDQPELLQALQDHFSGNGACTVEVRTPALTGKTETWVTINEALLKHIPTTGKPDPDGERFKGVYAAASEEIIRAVGEVAAQHGFKPVETSRSAAQKPTGPAR